MKIQQPRLSKSTHSSSYFAQASQIMSNAKIMMVDDEPINMEVLQVHLEFEGYNCFITLSDSTKAIATLKAEQPDVLLLDLVMPEVSGFDILNALRQDSEIKQIPVVVLTSSNDPQTKLQALQLGATDFLAKPVDASELALRLRNTLAAREYQQRLMYFDPLTELPNRQRFTLLLRKALHAAKCGNVQAVLLLININRFKAINDSLGPEHGDEVLWAFSRRVMAAFEMPDIEYSSYATLVEEHRWTARFGGDRFAVLLPSEKMGKDNSHLLHCMDNLQLALQTPFVVDEQNIYLTISIGVSTLNQHTATTELLVNDAETAMVHAQRRTDACYAFYSEQMDEKARELLSFENGLRTAVEDGEIFVVFQPKVEIASNTISGAEALARWKHPEFGMISPVDFIPLAENSGMIVSIGEWVLRESCLQAVKWRKCGYVDFKIAVNVSIRQLREADFITIVKNVLEETELPADALIIELTENMIMENAESNVVKLQRLKSLGVQISIDDFGTGYSSLSYLQRFPLDQLKIDRSFIREISSFKDRVPIVKAVVSLAHDLGLSVVAEGVETHHQLAHMKSLHCEEFQGYLCSRPLVAEEFLVLLNSDIDLRKSA